MKEEIKETYGSMIKELRIKNGLTQCEVAKALNVTPGYISHVENNRTAMSLRILIFYAKTIGISLDALVGQLEPDYKATAIDNEILNELTGMKDSEKTALLQTIKLWKHVK
ncbi:MAG: helix-turn-helix domain-containing protein [Lachnospiraceae bacterium]|nr:helix-turn-helix domain-containing protein [Lachnospiraceae bacterium]